ncbi:PQQ-binding-like beta-propeller repeat protein [Haloferax sp. MBLA0076]|uniref:PQQ-binding-like beta-propeller repeat protein n=1 Tax=Haloferax litoreum TaxID=2666140 RepID=A0A6A8GHM1_9EURY|nr:MULTISPECIES: PQQ-like beta-propeller repeat protein [Haloferax]KAB1194127.1 PQQ-binding-like beta-propeller repeat protein [Haloferax sp. CBA1148]MRX22683.1 PQQ-binding-like beta-propeller repeat protein [Haloferax litoreum]
MVSRRTFLSTLSVTVAGCTSTSSPDPVAETSRTTVTQTTTSPPTTTESATKTTETTREPACDGRWSPTVQWSLETEVRAFQPTVADGVVYAGSQDGTLYAVAAGTGRLRWRVPSDPGFGTVPVVSGQTVTLAGYDEVAAYDVATGDERWSFTPPGEYASLTDSHGDDGDTVFVGASQRPTPETDPDNVYDRVYALDRVSGNRRWQVSIAKSDDPDAWAVPDAVVVDSGRVFVSTEQSELVVLDASDGSVRWRRRFGDSNHRLALPVVAGDSVYQQASRTGYVLDVETGTERWRAPAERRPAVAGDASYWIDGLTLVARATSDGSVRWKRAIPTEGCPRTPRVGDGVLYVPVGCTDSNASIHALDLSNLCWVGSFELDSRNATTPVVSDGSVYVGGLNGAGNLWSLSAVGTDDSS